MDQHSTGLGDRRDPLQVNPRDFPVSNSPVMGLQGHITKPESFACLFVCFVSCIVLGYQTQVFTHTSVSNLLTG